jgi:hypothetical protein
MTVFRERRAAPGELLKGNPMKRAPKVAKDDQEKAGSDHLAFIRSLPCLVTGAKSEAAHVSFTLKIAGKADKGVGKKSSDVYTVPLCHVEHMKQHAHPKGEVGFWAEHGLKKEDVIILCLRLWTHSGSPAGAMKAIEDARSVMKVKP